MATVDRVAWELAAAQGGVCTRAQLVARGCSSATVSRRIGDLLHAVRPGLFVVGRPPEGDELVAAAVLVLAGAVASHQTAARQHHLPVPGDGREHVTVPRGATHDLPGVVVHETRHLPDADIERSMARPVTTPARTLVDLAADLRPSRLQHLVERQLIDGRPRQEELVACFRAAARRGRPGIGRLRSVLDSVIDDEPFPESELELALVRMLVTAGLDGFRRQHRPPWYDGRRGTVDAAHPMARLVIEADGRRWHATSQALDDDRRRDRMAVAHGWRVLRFGWQELTRRPDQVAHEVRAAVSTLARGTGVAA